MATTVDTILVRVEADLKDVNAKLAKLERNTKKATDSVNKGFNRIATGAKALVGGVMVLQLARGAGALINLASAAEEMRNKSATVFGAFAGEVTKELNTFADATGRSIIELERMASSVQDTFVPLGFARGEAAGLSVQLTKLATDVASFQNAQDPDVMQAFQSALVGNHEAVYRFGIVINESTLQAELNRMGIKKNINAITNEEKVRARLNLLIAGSADALGDTIKTADSFENSQKRMNAELTELAVGVLTPLLPKLADMAQKIADGADALHDFLTAVGLADSGLTGLAEAERKFAEQQIKVAEIQNRINQMSALQLKRRGSIKKALEDETKILEIFRNEMLELKADTEELQAAEEALDEQRKKAKATQLEAAESRKLSSALEKEQILQQKLQEIKRTGNELDGEILAAKLAISGKNSEELDQLEEIMRSNYALNESLERQKEVYASVKGATEQFGNSIATTLADGLLDGKLALDDFKNIARNFVSTLISEFIRLYIIRNILSSIFPSGQTTFGGGGGGGGGFSIPPIDAVSSAGLATGGTAQRGRPALVGERGPEIIIPNTASTVMNSNNTRSALGGGSVVVNQSINVSTGVSQTVRAELANFLPVIQSQTLNAVAQAKAKGGRMSEVL